MPFVVVADDSDAFSWSSWRPLSVTLFVFVGDADFFGGVRLDSGFAPPPANRRPTVPPPVFTRVCVCVALVDDDVPAAAVVVVVVATQRRSNFLVISSTDTPPTVAVAGRLPLSSSSSLVSACARILSTSVAG